MTMTQYAQPVLTGVGQIGVDWPLESIWSTTVGFVALVVLLVAFIGMLSKSLSIPALASYVTFSWYASEVGNELLETILYVTLTLVIVGTAFKLWRLEGVGDI